MRDSNSKFPDFKEITGMVKKFLCDINASIQKIIQDYKTKQGSSEHSSTKTNTTTSSTSAPKPAPHSKQQPSQGSTAANSPMNEIRSNSTKTVVVQPAKPMKKTSTLINSDRPVAPLSPRPKIAVKTTKTATGKAAKVTVLKPTGKTLAEKKVVKEKAAATKKIEKSKPSKKDKDDKK